MTQPTLGGRKFPLNDWEGDDFTPGAGGDYVTCMDTATGRMVAWATNGRIVRDGRWYRSQISPPDSNGTNFAQMDTVLHTKLTPPLDIIYASSWNKTDATRQLRMRHGLIVTGIYDRIPRQYRHQRAGDFMHAMFVTHIARDGRMRLYDPLDPRTDLYGRSVPSSILWPFLQSSGSLAGYVNLQDL